MTNSSANSDQNHERAEAGALGRRATAIVEDILAYCSDRDRVSVGEVINRLGSSGLAVSVLILVLPALVPVPGPYGMVFGTVVAILSVQMIWGRSRPWLPSTIARRTLATEHLINGGSYVRSWLARVERFHAPGRMQALAGRHMTRIAGCIILPLAVIIALPIPFGNVPPVLAIAMIALALILKDGLALIIAFVAAMLAAASIGSLIWFGNEFLVRLFSFWQIG